MEKKKNKMNPIIFWIVVVGMGLAGQLCWNMENQWFNTFVYAKIEKNVDIVTAMVIVSALVTTISTFIFGTLSDRLGKRKIFVCVGYILWGIATIVFGLTEFLRDKIENTVWLWVPAFLVIFTDAVMSFFGSMGNDSGYNVWLNDYTTDKNKGQIGAILAALPVIGTVLGTVLGGALVGFGNDTGNPENDNYQLLFGVMGAFVILIGIVSLFFVKDAPNVKASKEGSFIRQVTSVFNFKDLKGNKNNKELLLANLVACCFFIPFNFYFTHMGNWLLYDIGFTAGDMGLIQGIALLLAVVVTIPFSKLINKEKTPLVALIAVICNAIGLVLIYILVKDKNSVDTTNLFALKNMPAFFCVFLVGTGYVLITQSCMIWVKGLFPEKNKGQFEGLRVLFFTLIPMIIGTLIGNVIIKQTAQVQEIKDDFGNIIDVPQENMFLWAGLIVLVTLIPLYFATKAYKKRIKEKQTETLNTKG